MRSMNGGAPDAAGAHHHHRQHPTTLPEGLACCAGTYGAACRLARLGVPVFPCRPNSKAPATPHGFQDATTNTARLEAWWGVSDGGETRPLNLAIATGRASGLWVVDLDGEEGLETLEALEAEHGPLPPTVTVATPSGGQHLYFRLPEGVEVRSRARVLPGVDVRGDGGYVLAPPSTVDGRHYRWLRLGEVADPPEWLLEIAAPRSEPQRASAPPSAAARWPEGHRNDRLFREGCALRRRGYSASEIEAALLALNAQRCDPPLDESEVRKIAHSAARYEPAEGGPGEPELDTTATLAPAPTVPLDALPGPLRDLVHSGRRTGLPDVCLLGAGLAAAAGAIGGRATLERGAGWAERPILWCALIGPPGAGKSPALRLATQPLHEHDGALLDDDERWESGRVVASDTTLEALARALHSTGGALLLEADELREWLEGLGRYKRRADSDRARALSLWDGAPWSYERVAGGGRRNALRFAVPRPTVPIVGCLTLERHRLLGEDSDGMRPRWLPWVTAHTAGTPNGAGRAPHLWESAIRELLEVRDTERFWALDNGAQKALQAAESRWATQRRDATPQLARALAKAPRQALRIALVLAELDSPGAGGAIGRDVAESATSILEVALAGWRALPEGRTLALSRRDRTLDSAIDALVAWLDERGGTATRRDLLRAHVAGVRTARDLDALIERYRETYPGCVREEPSRGGRRVVITSPRSPSPLSISVATRDRNKNGGADRPENPHHKAKNTPRRLCRHLVATGVVT